MSGPPSPELASGVEFVDSIRELFQAINGLIQWLITTLHSLGLGVDIRLIWFVAGMAFLMAGFYLVSHVRRGRPHAFLYAIGALISFAIPLTILLTVFGALTYIPGVNLYKLGKDYGHYGDDDIMLLPYTLSTGSNETFQLDLRRGIKTQIDRLGVKYDHRDVNIATIRGEVFTEDPRYEDAQWSRSIGKQLNALGIVGIVEERSGKHLTALLTPVPKTELFRPPTELIEEEHYDSVDFHAKMSTRWGRAVVLAIATRELHNGMRGNDVRSLAAAREYFQSIRDTLPAGEESLAKELARIVESIDKRVASE